MCGRYLMLDEKDEVEIQKIIDTINRRNAEQTIKLGMVYPTDVAPVLIGEGRKIAAKAMRWGFLGFNGKGVVINARSETARQKPMFRDSIKKRRAVIPTCGFYEWRHEGKAWKEMYLFRESGHTALYLAGMYKAVTLSDGRTEERFTILTTTANNSMEPYHDRMPVILSEAERQSWLTEPDAADEILHRVPVELEAQHIEREARSSSQEQISLF